MGSYYPLSGVDLDFRRYAHRPFGGRDIFINRIVEDLLNPRRVSPSTYLEATHHPTSFGRVKLQDRELGLDLQVLCRLLQMEWPTSVPILAPTSVMAGPPVHFLARMIQALKYAEAPITVQQAIVELVQTHYFECDPLIHQAKNLLVLEIAIPERLRVGNMT
ncbi:hypothetical protein CIB48_g915 [Xylaria polymorpha]|nr:hypothetical protein CIB48_g915 [Xylaria polymorpha]